MRRFLLRALVLLGLSIALIWPALLNHGPFVFPDTRTYMRAADAIVSKLTHRKTAWTAADDHPVADGGQTANNSDQALHNLGVVRTRSLSEISKKGVILGRSPYYGMLLYIGAITGGFWLTMLLQAGALLLTLSLALRGLGYPVWPILGYLTLALCVVSDAAFFTSYLMPDVFAGIAILLCALLLSVRSRLDRTDLVLCYLLLTTTMLFHDSCTLISVSLLGFAILVGLFRRSWISWRRLGIVLLAVITAYAGQSVIALGVKRATGEAPLRLPFISARLIADGPGTNYLRATCPGSHFILCEYVNEFPMGSEDFLFAAKPGKSVFELASYDQRRAISAEQVHFLFAVIKYDPVAVLKSSARNAGTQLIDFTLKEFRYSLGFKDALDRTLPLQALAQVRGTAAYLGTMPVGFLSVVLYIAVFGSLVYLLLAFSGRLPGRRAGDGLKMVACWVFAGIVLNAAITGCLSVVIPRFQARVIWLIPLCALLLEAQVWIDRNASVFSAKKSEEPRGQAIGIT